MNKRYTILSILAVLALSATAQLPTETSLLQRQSKQLSIRYESVAKLLAQTKEMYAASPNDSLSLRIYDYEHQMAKISHYRREVEQKLAAMQTAQSDSTIVAEDTAVVQTMQPDSTTVAVNTSTVQAMQPDSIEVAAEEIAAEPNIKKEPESAPLLRIMNNYAEREREVSATMGDYAAVYASAVTANRNYADATNVADADKYFAASASLIAQASKTADRFADKSEALYGTKSEAYCRLADSLGLTELKNDFMAKVQWTKALKADIRGKYADDDMAMYPFRKADIMYLEVKLARHLGATATVDSLLREMAKISPADYQLEPLRKLSKADTKFAETVVLKKAKYSSASAIPKISVPDKGELYAILLGNYSQLPPMSTLRNVSPLSSERREDGRTYIFVGRYPTAASATEGVALLRKIGFKQPTVVMWRNGMRRDDFVDRRTVKTEKMTLYKVEIGNADVLPEAIRKIIQKTAPRKEISKITTDNGSTIYTVGTFSNKSESDALIKAISAADSSLSLKTMEISK